MIVFKAILIAAFFFAIPGIALAQMACDTRDSVVEKLGEKYGEVRGGGGLAGPTAIFEIWASEATGTWTILKTTPNGLTCIMAVGDNWVWYNEDEVEGSDSSGDPI